MLRFHKHLVMPAFAGMTNVHAVYVVIPVKTGIQETTARRRISSLTSITS